MAISQILLKAETHIYTHTKGEGETERERQKNAGQHTCMSVHSKIHKETEFTGREGAKSICYEHCSRGRGIICLGMETVAFLPWKWMVWDCIIRE